MNYLYQLEEKRKILKNKIATKEEEFTNYISPIPTNNNGSDIISKISNELSLISTFTDGIRVGISVLKIFYK